MCCCPDVSGWCEATEKNNMHTANLPTLTGLVGLSVEPCQGFARERNRLLICSTVPQPVQSTLQYQVLLLPLLC